MNIVVCPNDYFTMPCTVMLCSLLENNRDVNHIMIHVLVDGTFQEGNKNIIKGQLSRYNNASVHFYCIKEDWLKGITIGEASLVQIPIVTFFRLFMSEIFPEEVEKVLYLDSDMIVRKSLKGLYQTNLENKAVAAVIDTFNYKIDIYNNLRYKPALGYFNAGMLLVNLKYWREHNVLGRCIDFIKNYPERMKYLDQDVLNYVLCEEKIFVPLTYNAQTSFFLKTPPISWELDEELKELVKDPCIIHYVGSYKPWQKEYNLPHPYKADFFKYQLLTCWANSPLMKSTKKISNREKVKSLFYNILRKIGLLSAPRNTNPFRTI